ncbi:Acylpyruvase FAHD1, mitochondrial [Galdieria sulphuraria]|uniref:5-oxopent-3-end-1,2,5-tricarboxylate decarboxylase n=1 Tax=Galdieria sulphuraria TaxID=130081 RepID=M2WR59_GALSU|nr:5-oxopent-3-end-1,2,5-tricarboxylate decarboxylase [Galdieria sulphuraria]EME26290.1 5-oxopent-3-end-1,2,5-tricarboxylate decarboxylase [Galdieria sulphuraria]GJD09445.1 Acylpyruvase FAHD1, mitochondrial [Galdieria sulphuraria]|eukprot:XP_005702810.1 5-oxopent-3-end-1,2,5-tricarboxylate decarboxylase [Galdieria sulphuraria]
MISSKAICVGKNYEKHAREMGDMTTSRGEPILFLKPSSSYLEQGNPILLPKGAQVHHEVELGVVIGTSAQNVSVERALDYVQGYLCCLDMTARNWQSTAASKGEPWTLAKGCDTFLPMSNQIPKERIPDPQKLDIWLKVNGEYRQRGYTKDMIFSVAELIAYTSKYITLYPGDLLLTGTPEGVGPVYDGDVIEAGITDITEMQFLCKAKS